MRTENKEIWTRKNGQQIRAHLPEEAKDFRCPDQDRSLKPLKSNGFHWIQKVLLPQDAEGRNPPVERNLVAASERILSCGFIVIEIK